MRAALVLAALVFSPIAFAQDPAIVESAADSVFWTGQGSAPVSPFAVVVGNPGIAAGTNLVVCAAGNAPPAPCRWNRDAANVAVYGPAAWKIGQLSYSPMALAARFRVNVELEPGDAFAVDGLELCDFSRASSHHLYITYQLTGPCCENGVSYDSRSILIAEPASIVGQGRSK